MTSNIMEMESVGWMMKSTILSQNDGSDGRVGGKVFSFDWPYRSDKIPRTPFMNFYFSSELFNIHHGSYISLFLEIRPL